MTVAVAVMIAMKTLMKKEEEGEVGGGERDIGRISLMIFWSLNSEREERYIVHFLVVIILLYVFPTSYTKRAQQKRYQVSENLSPYNACHNNNNNYYYFSVTCRPRLQIKGSQQLLSHSKPLTKGPRTLPHQAQHCSGGEC